jgi:tetratricopeptide (TPR) repeat protein
MAVDDYALGLQLERDGDLQGAEAALGRAAAAGSLDAAVVLASLLLNRGARDDAEDLLARAAEAGSDMAAGNLGSLLIARDEPQAALAWLEPAAARGWAPAARHLGNALHNLGRMTDAEQAWRRAEQLGDMFGALNLGLLLLRRGKRSEGVAAWERAANGGSAEAALELSLLADDEGRGDESDRWRERAGELLFQQRYPSPPWWMTKDVASFSIDELDEAHAHLREWDERMQQERQATQGRETYADLVLRRYEAGLLVWLTDACQARAALMRDDTLSELYPPFAIPRARLVDPRTARPIDATVGISPGVAVVLLDHRQRELAFIPWGELRDLVVEGPNETAQRVTATRVLALGPLAWALRKPEKNAFLIIEAQSTLFVQVEMTVFELRARLDETMRLVKRETTQAVRTQPEGDVADGLERLVGLREAGHLNDEEFAAAKRRLLAA